jgi:DNA polymerase
VAPATDAVIAALGALREEVERCSNCILAETRTKAVFGEGDPGADLMFIGEAPGYHEDQQGRPFVGQAGKLLEQLLASVGMTREQVYIANVLKSRPPNNRDPRPEEIDACRPYLWRQIEIIRPKVICTLGNFATKLLSGDQRGITKVHGQPRATEISGHRLYLYPIFHPAAALYTPANLATLKEDFLRLPELLAHGAPQPGEESAAPPGERPAWQPPARLQAPPAAPHGGPLAPALTFDSASPAPVDPAPAVATAELRPAPDDPASAPHEIPVAAFVSDDDPAPASPPAPEAAPPAEPEQLGLF